MYILKNAWRCITRAKGRNILIGLIALVIAVSACIGLSIRQAAERARTELLEGISVTATIELDRQSMMQGMRPPSGGGTFDQDEFLSMMGGLSALTLAEYEAYAQAPSVRGFYYTLSAAVNGSDAFSPVSTTGSSGNGGTSGRPSFGGDFGGFGGLGGPGATGDFTIIGYSSEAAMDSFQSGTAKLSEGRVFEEGTIAYDCIIPSELATYNTISVGDTITVFNPQKEDESYTLTVVGIYTAENTGSTASILAGGSDPANRILMSAQAVQEILDASAAVSTTVTDAETGRTSETKLKGSLSGTYVLADVAAFEAFQEEVRALGLSDSYTVSSPDLNAYESSLTPLNTLSTMAGWFLVVILLIGASVLIVLNIFNIRERKYEIGVLCAMGMKKAKVATQFVCEILIVTMIAILVGAGIGAVSSVPVTNALLAGQVESQQSSRLDIESGFGRGEFPGGGGMPNMPDMPDMPNMPNMPNMPTGGMLADVASYVTEVNAAMDLTVVLQLLGVGLLLALVAGTASVLFVMRYDPLKILSNRD